MQASLLNICKTLFCSLLGFRELSQSEISIIKVLKENGDMTRTEIETKLNLKARSSRYTLDKLISEKIVKKVGSGKNTKYSLLV